MGDPGLLLLHQNLPSPDGCSRGENEAKSIEAHIDAIAMNLMRTIPAGRQEVRKAPKTWNGIKPGDMFLTRDSIYSTQSGIVPWGSFVRCSEVTASHVAFEVTRPPWDAGPDEQPKLGATIHYHSKTWQGLFKRVPKPRKSKKETT